MHGRADVVDRGEVLRLEVLAQLVDHVDEDIRRRGGDAGARGHGARALHGVVGAEDEGHGVEQVDGRLGGLGRHGVVHCRMPGLASGAERLVARPRASKADMRTTIVKGVLVLAASSGGWLCVPSSARAGRGCTLVKGTYTLRLAGISRRGLRKSIRWGSSRSRWSGSCERRLRELVTALGKNVAAPEQTPDVIFRIVPATEDRHRASARRDQPLATGGACARHWHGSSCDAALGGDVHRPGRQAMAAAW